MRRTNESSDTLSLTFDRLFEEMTGQESDIDFDSDAYVYVNSQTPDAPFRRARRGIIVVGDRDTVRAMEPFSGPEANLVRYASTVNAYSRALGDSVTVYCMPIPTQVDSIVRRKPRSIHRISIWR